MAIDAQAFRVEADGSVTQTIADTQEGVALVSGPARLIQRFALELFTEKDSIPYWPGRGSRFLTLLRDRASTESDVFAAFASSLVDIRRNLQSEEADTDPPEERFRGARVSNILVDRGHVGLTISITSRAQKVVTITLPLPLLL